MNSKKYLALALLFIAYAGAADMGGNEYAGSISEDYEAIYNDMDDSSDIAFGAADYAYDNDDSYEVEQYIYNGADDADLEDDVIIQEDEIIDNDE